MENSRLSPTSSERKASKALSRSSPGADRSWAELESQALGRVATCSNQDSCTPKPETPAFAWSAPASNLLCCRITTAGWEESRVRKGTPSATGGVVRPWQLSRFLCVFIWTCVCERVYIMCVQMHVSVHAGVEIRGGHSMPSSISLSLVFETVAHWI